jgi:hypothetical protein
MSLVADFLTNGVAPFMNAHTLSLPGALIDGGTIDYTDPAYAPALGRSRKIVVPTSTVAASWVPGRRPRDAQLLLKVSRAYKMASTGRTEPGAGGGGVAPLKGEYERERTALKQQAISGGLARKAYSPTDYANEGVRLTGKQVDEWFDCYFLPYSQGRHVCMQLGGDADYFFTATMNGCSFMVSGDADAPSVSHLNVTRPADTVEGAVVTRADIKRRYRRMTGAGSDEAALLTKFERHPAFKGDGAEYNLTAEELAAIDDTDIVPETRTRADVQCFVVGERTVTGWRFYYQRAAALVTHADVSTQQITPVPKSRKHQLRRALGMSYKVKPQLSSTTTRLTAKANHVVTACADLPFNVVALA